MFEMMLIAIKVQRIYRLEQNNMRFHLNTEKVCINAFIISHELMDYFLVIFEVY